MVDSGCAVWYGGYVLPLGSTWGGLYPLRCNGAVQHCLEQVMLQ
jgi:hypothetical protein